MTLNPVQKGVRLLGGPTIVANLLGVSRQTVYDWQTKGWITDENITAFIEAVAELGETIEVDDVRRPLAA